MIPALVAALPVIARVAASVGGRAVAAGAAEGSMAARAGSAAQKAAPFIRGGNHGNEGEPRKANFQMGSGLPDIASSTNDWRPY